MDLILVIDGGGSGCRSALVHLDGLDGKPKILGRGLSGAANVASDFDQTFAHLLEVTDLAIKDSGLEIKAETLDATLGLAGVNGGDYTKRLEKALPFKKTLVVSDAISALYGALEERDGVMAAIGTGSVFVCKKGEEINISGGWGFQTSDLHGGARLGQRLIEYSLLAYDGFEEACPLSDAILAKFLNDPIEVSSFGRRATPKDFGQFAPMIFDFAEKGDEVANKMLKQVVEALCRHILALTGGDQTSKICLTGGLGVRYLNHFPYSFQERLVKARGTPLEGGIYLARQNFYQSK